VLLSIITLGLLPLRSSMQIHTARWASALALAQLAEVGSYKDRNAGGLGSTFSRKT